MEESPINKELSKWEAKPLGPEEVVALFDTYRGTAAYPSFMKRLTDVLNSKYVTPFFKKDRNLPLLIHTLLEQGKFPLIDKTSKFVLIPRSHTYIRAMLYCLYKNIPFEDFDGEEYSKHADGYTAEGMGYYWTSALGGKGILMAGESYKPTREDTETWLMVTPADKS